MYFIKFCKKREMSLRLFLGKSSNAFPKKIAKAKSTGLILMCCAPLKSRHSAVEIWNGMSSYQPSFPFLWNWQELWKYLSNESIHQIIFEVKLHPFYVSILWKVSDVFILLKRFLRSFWNEKLVQRSTHLFFTTRHTISEMQKAASIASALVLFFQPAVLIFGLCTAVLTFGQCMHKISTTSVDGIAVICIISTDIIILV